VIREGDAISLVLPERVRPEVASGEFAVREIDVPPSCLRGGMVWLAERSPSPAALAFVRELLIEVGLDRDPSLR
jgi:DNA-binding transcriptional LysR family regulator